jgi:metal-responsive CopG/Arc/MetJ family transcriptional regulator
MSDKRPVSVYMPKSLILRARIEAAKRNMSRSAFVTEAVQKAIGESQQRRGGQQQADSPKA